MGRGKGNKGGRRKRRRDDEKEDLEKGGMRRTIKNGKVVGGMVFRGKYGNMGERKWRSRYGDFLIKFGKRMAGSGEEGRDRIHYKRGEDKVKDYRGVTLMLSVYKIYTMVLAERLREEMEWGEASCIIKRNSGKGIDNGNN